MSVFRVVPRWLWKSEQGQDLAEYCLLTALVVLIAAGIFYRVSGGMQNLWTTANTTLATQNSTGGQGSGGDATASRPNGN